MSPASADPRRTPSDDPGNAGTEAQEQDPTIGPGTHPDAEQDADPEANTPGGRP